VNSHIWGVQVRTKMVSYIIHPANDSHLDVVMLGGTLDLFRLRGETPYVLTRSSLQDDTSLPNLKVMAVGSSVEPSLSGVPGSTLLTEFCSEPAPDTRHHVDDEGRFVIELAPADVGKQHAVTAFFAQFYGRSQWRFRHENEVNFGSTGNITTPIETMIVDLVIADGAYGSQMPTPVGYLVTNFQSKPLPLKEIERRHAREILETPPVTYLGKAPRALDTPDIPRYLELFEHVCQRVRWEPSAFHVFRCRVEYPVLPSSLVVGFDLPEKPA